MIQILSYSLTDNGAKVKLGCSCGNREIQERKDEDDVILSCKACGAESTLFELRKEATGYWRDRPWNMNTVKKRGKGPRYEVDIPVKLVIKEALKAPPFCVLNGAILMLSANHLHCLVDNFDEKYFEPLTTKHRFALLRATIPLDDFPSEIFAKLVGINYKPEQLPLCQLALSTKHVPEDTRAQLDNFITLVKEKTELPDEPEFD